MVGNRHNNTGFIRFGFETTDFFNEQLEDNFFTDEDYEIALKEQNELDSRQSDRLRLYSLPTGSYNGNADSQITSGAMSAARTYLGKSGARHNDIGIKDAKWQPRIGSAHRLRFRLVDEDAQAMSDLVGINPDFVGTGNSAQRLVDNSRSVFLYVSSRYYEDEMVTKMRVINDAIAESSKLLVRNTVSVMVTPAKGLAHPQAQQRSR